MRCKRHLQPSLFESFVDHECVDELKRVSDLLDRLPELVDLVAKDVGTGRGRGPAGISAESVLRIGYLIHRHQLSYQRMSFQLCDSGSVRAFARLASDSFPKKSVLQKVVSQVSAATWKEIGKPLVLLAQAEGVESGKKVRIDSTVSQTHIAAPSDSLLLVKCVKSMLGLLDQGSAFVALRYRNCRRAATWRQMAIQYGHGKEKRTKHYQQLMALTRKTLRSLEQMQSAYKPESDGGAWGRKVERLVTLVEQVIDQTRKRVIEGESVPASDKIVSLFQPHTNIIRKGGRETHYGHKVNLVTGASCLILSLQIEDGNPTDSHRFIPMLQRVKELYGRAPDQVAADGGYCSQANFEQARAMGICDVVFTKAKGVSTNQMARNRRVYRQLKKFRSNVEAQIGNLKNLFGVGRVNRSGRKGFDAYIMCAVFAYNATVLTHRLRTSS